MKHYTLLKPTRGCWAILANYVCNDDNEPPPDLISKLAAWGYSLVLRHPTYIPNQSDWEKVVRDEIRADNDLELGVEWPDK